MQMIMSEIEITWLIHDAKDNPRERKEKKLENSRPNKVDFKGRN